MLQYKVYLLGELGKLRGSGDARAFIRAMDSGFLGEVGLNASPEGLSRQFSDQAAVESFVEGCNDAALVRLTRAIDVHWRRNGVSMKVAAGARWGIREVGVGDVDLQQAEPHLAHIFRRHDGRLVDIAGDSELLTSRPYSEWSIGTPVDYPVLLALRGGGRHRVFDGIHRAVQLAINGEGELRLCEPD